jgi:hypothetical protein
MIIPPRNNKYKNNELDINTIGVIIYMITNEYKA